MQLNRRKFLGLLAAAPVAEAAMARTEPEPAVSIIIKNRAQVYSHLGVGDYIPATFHFPLVGGLHARGVRFCPERAMLTAPVR